MPPSKKRFIIIQLVIIVTAMLALILYTKHSSVTRFIYSRF